MKLNLSDCALDEKGKEEFLDKTDNFHDVFSLRDEIGTCPFIKVHLKLESNFETPMMLSQGLTTRCLYCFKIHHYYILNTL